MKAYAAKFKYGFLYDQETDKRIILAEGSKLTITVEVSKCISENLEFFEPIYAYSLNDAYSKTYDFYFRLYGKQAANAKEKIMEGRNGEKNFLKRLLRSSTSPDIIL